MKKKNQNFSSKYYFFVFVFVVSIFSGFLGAFLYDNIYSKENNVLGYYEKANAVLISPTQVKSLLDRGYEDMIIVDLRDRGSYERGHAVTAINIPAGSLTEIELVREFQKLDQSKKIITYCYSSSCMLSNNVGLVLARAGINTMHLTVGAVEWLNDSAQEYIVLGPEPGEAVLKEEPSSVCSVGIGFSC